MILSEPRQQTRALLICLIVTFAAAAIGAAASVHAKEFYQQLSNPSWAPPASWFGPVWSVLYCLMAIAAFLVWQRQGWHKARTALSLYAVQLVFNSLWSWLFFYWHQGALAFANIIVLWLLIGATIVSFWQHRRSAALLLLPYWLWVSFASVLNYAVWQANPLILG